MKKFLMLAIMLTVAFFATTAFATTSVTFQWDRNTETDMSGYRLYQTTTSGVYVYGTGSANYKGNLAQPAVGVVPTYTLSAIPDGSYCWVATAYDTGSNESGPSNEICRTLDSVAPSAPKTLIITITTHP